MFYKLSNTSELIDIENEFKTPFRFPSFYEPKAIINGLQESNIPVITSEDISKIDFAIWGLLPEGYDDNWDIFQDVTNTLNINIDDQGLHQDFYAGALENRRCLIIVNGFFTSHLLDGKLCLHYVHLKHYKPFCIAGIYNKINDGFLTCSVLVTNSGNNFKGIPNLGKLKPLIFKKKDHRQWLNTNQDLENLRPLIKNHDQYDFISKPINTELFNRSKDSNYTLGDDFARFNLKIS